MNLHTLVLAIAAAGVLNYAPPTIMPTRNRRLEHGHNMNEDIDLTEKSRRREARKAKLKAVGQRAMTK